MTKFWITIAIVYAVLAYTVLRKEPDPIPRKRTYIRKPTQDDFLKEMEEVLNKEK
jgi:hypothetical protein